MFKESFKYYKSKLPLPSLDNVIDFNNVEKFTKKVTKIILKVTNGEFFGLIPISEWEIYEVDQNPGLIFIKNPFTTLGQRYWTVKCLQEYTKKPNKSNLDPLNLVPDNQEWWDICQNNNDFTLLEKLRWITLGYHHNWDTKIYTEENKNDFPKDLGDLTVFFANTLGYSNFNAEAAIVNYYHLDSTLSGHTDHSEMNLEAPLFSFSLGQTAIFLLGGISKDTKPSAMFLRSGDVVIMSKESRLCYHGVPKIVKSNTKSWDITNCDVNSNEISEEYKTVTDLCKNSTLWRPYGDYLSHSRININVRQVLKRGQKRLNSESNENVT
ncbi:unnamed protein product [Brassicogethes aeneus]|uniref:Fe2OG dioxygenase domain-containing protein n=1 Tax=Brassicogethes aeneus TaxID=1431903 RepID=A0A9P0BDQ8_BRAAE|nr:unnamed protein product [Brassicogethes aeneus]